MECWKKRVAEFSWNNNGKELPIVPVVHGTDASNVDSICDSGFTTISSRYQSFPPIHEPRE